MKRIVLVNLIFQILQKERALSAINAFNKALHAEDFWLIVTIKVGNETET